MLHPVSPAPDGFFINALSITMKLVGRLFQFNIDHLFICFYSFGFAFIFSWLCMKFWNWYQKGSGDLADGISCTKDSNGNNWTCGSYFSGSMLYSILELNETYYEPKIKSCLKENTATNEFSPDSSETTLVLAKPRQTSTISSFDGIKSSVHCFVNSISSFTSVKPICVEPMLSETNVLIITLHQLSRSEGIPCQCPQRFCLESILRLCELPYKVIYKHANSSSPWLSYGEEHFEGMDSCMGFLEKSFPRELEKYQVPESHKVPARYILTTNDHLTIALNYWRAQKEATKPNKHQSNGRYTSYAKKYMHIRFVIDQIYSSKDMFAESSRSELLRVIRDDLLALSTSLDDQLGFAGKRLTILDCLLFSTLAQFLWSSASGAGENPNDILEELIGQHPNLVSFCQQVRSVLWYDWPTREMLEKDESCYYTIKIKSGFVKGSVNKSGN